jgi:hypothetical protein
VLGDLGANATRDASESNDAGRALFVAAFFLALRAQAADAIGSASSFSDDTFVALVEHCTEQLVLQIATFIPAGDDYWTKYRGLDARLPGGVRFAVDQPNFGAVDPRDFLYSSRAKAGSIVVLAAAYLAGVTDAGRCDSLCATVEQLAAAYQIRADLTTLRQDVLEGTVSYPIALACQAAGLPLHPLPDPIVVLGAMAVTGSLDQISREIERRFDAARQMAVATGLGTLARFIDDASGRPRPGRSLNPARSIAPRSGPITIRVSDEPRPSTKAIEMAQSFLDADRTFRESWETHREGMLGSKVVASRFPAGLILEILRRTGLELAEGIADFLRFTEANGFRYYDHPDSDVDTDTVGLYLRLAGPSPEGRRPPALTTALQCLETIVRAQHNVPVWLVGCDDNRLEKSVTLGEGCATVAAHLLIGLAELSDESSRQTFLSGAGALIARLHASGLGANLNYPPLYALSVFVRLLDKIEELNEPSLAAGVGSVRSKLIDELEIRSHASNARAQDAALLISACSATGRLDLIKPRHLSSILKRQGFDGGWSGAPFAVAPNRGQRVSPYSSSTLTTALCYEALVTAQDLPDAIGRGARQ